MLTLLFATLLCVVSPIKAIPADTVATSAACPASGLAANSLSACATATAFCEKYLSQKPSTVHQTFKTTTTVYSSTITSTASTTTVTKSVTSCMSIAGVGPTGTLTTAVGSGGYDYATYTGVKKRTAAAPAPSCGLGQVKRQAVSSACSCVLTTTVSTTKTITKATDTTTTTTATATTTVTVNGNCATPDTSCGNAGFAVAYYRVPQDQLGTSWDPQSAVHGDYDFDPTLYKTRIPPRVTFQETQLSGWTSQGFSTNLSSPNAYPFFQFYQQGEPFTSFVINHVMYFYPPVSGTYAINIIDADNYIGTWMNSEAYAGWTSDNAFSIDTEVTAPESYLVNLEAGQYYPLRVIMGGGGTPNVLSMSITAPDGTLLLASAQQTGTSYFVTQSCDGTTAPPFPPFGNEPTS